MRGGARRNRGCSASWVRHRRRPEIVAPGVLAEGAEEVCLEMVVEGTHVAGAEIDEVTAPVHYAVQYAVATREERGVVPNPRVEVAEVSSLRLGSERAEVFVDSGRDRCITHCPIERRELAFGRCAEAM